MASHVLTAADEQAIAAQAILLAKAARNPPGETLSRNQQGQVTFSDMQNREQFLASIIAYTEGNTHLFIDPMPGETLKEAQERPGRVSIPKARRWLEIWSSTYCDEPIRTFFQDREELTSDDEVATQLQERYRQAEVDLVLQDVDFGMRQTGNVVIRPWFDQDNDELVIHTYLSNSIRIVPNPNNPSRPFATILIGHRLQRTDDPHATSRHVAVAEIWTPTEFILWDEEKGAERFPLLTQAVPIVHCFEEKPTIRTGYYCPCPGPTLVQLNAILDNDFYGQLGYTQLMQGMGVAQIFGYPEGVTPIIGPGRALTFTGRNDRREGIEYASTNAPLAEWVDTIQFLADEAREAFGIPQSMLDVTTNASGAAIVQANGPVLEMRRKRQKHFRRIETELCRAIVDVLATHDENFKLRDVDPKSFDVSVKFEDGFVNVGTSERIALDKHLLEIGVLTPAAILMRENPDKFDTIEEAELFLTTQDQDDVLPEGEQEPESENVSDEMVTLLATDEPGGDHTHTATLDADGNGVSSPWLQDGHTHEIVGKEVQPSGDPEHTHPRVNPFAVLKSGDKYTVVNTDTGEVMGTHDTQEEAQAQLTALEINVKE